MWKETAPTAPTLLPIFLPLDLAQRSGAAVINSGRIGQARGSNIDNLVTTNHPMLSHTSGCGSGQGCLLSQQ